MKKQEESAEAEKVPCKVCLKEIPQSEAKVVEAEDYIMNFCGLDCYEQWQKQKGEKK